MKLSHDHENLILTPPHEALDASHARKFTEAAQMWILSHENRVIVIDLIHCQCIDSSGIQSLLMLKKLCEKQHKTLYVKNMHPRVTQALPLTHAFSPAPVTCDLNS